MTRTGENIQNQNNNRHTPHYIPEHDTSGQAIPKSAYNQNKAKIHEKVELADRTEKKIQIPPSPIEGKTFKQVAEEYLSNARSSIASTTYDRYRDALERDVYPEYANTPMKDVTDAEVKHFLKIATALAEKRGRSLTNSGLFVVKAVMGNVINYANAVSGIKKTGIVVDKTAYEELTAGELEMICRKAKHNHCPEMLAALLSIYCGMRTGELCALNSDDVDVSRNEIYIHEIAHRIRNPKKDEEGEKKTMIIIEEIPRKKQIRRIPYPAVLNDYMDEFRQQERTLIRRKDGGQTDPRTLENRLARTMSAFGMEGINFERLRKTYINGKADVQLLNHIFLGMRSDVSYGGNIDVEWLTDEMSRDLMPLRMLIGLTIEEAASLLGVSTGMYRQLENGSREVSWDQYMSILFLYHYNMRTTDIVNNLGLYPDSLKRKMEIGGE